jgi:hypothetical protein
MIRSPRFEVQGYRFAEESMSRSWLAGFTLPDRQGKALRIIAALIGRDISIQTREGYLFGGESNQGKNQKEKHLQGIC